MDYVSAILELIQSKIEYHERRAQRATLRSKSFCTTETHHQYMQCIDEYNLHKQEVCQFRELLTFAEKALKNIKEGL